MEGLWNNEPFRVAVDFGDPWVGPKGSQFVRESEAKRVAVLGPYIDQPGGTRVRTLDCIDFATHRSSAIAAAVSTATSDCKTMLYTEPAASTWTVGALDLATCDVTSLTDVESTAWSRGNGVVVRLGGGSELLWLGGSPPSSGVLCSDARGEFGDEIIFGCVEGASPHSLSVFNSRAGTAQVWTDDAVDAPSVTGDDDFATFAWIDSDGRLHARLAGQVELIADCPSLGSTFILPLDGISANQALAQCAAPAGSWLLDFLARKSTRHRLCRLTGRQPGRLHPSLWDGDLRARA